MRGEEHVFSACKPRLLRALERREEGTYYLNPYKFTWLPQVYINFIYILISKHLFSLEVQDLTNQNPGLQKEKYFLFPHIHSPTAFTTYVLLNLNPNPTPSPASPS